MDYSEEKFREHIKAVVENAEIDNEIGERALTLDELKELAISMGVTEEGWIDLLKKAETHLKSSDDHLKARNFKEAVLEGEQATAINPYITNGNSVLAKAYMMLWLEDRTDDLKNKAIFHARQELKVDPKDMAAINVLSTIEKKSKVIAQDNNTRKKILIAAGIGLALLFALLILAFSPWSSDTTEETTHAQDNSVRDALIEAEEDVKMKLDLVQTAIDRRNSLIPELFSAVEGSHEDLDVLKQTIDDLEKEINDAEGTRKFELENQLKTKLEEAKVLASKYADSGNIETLLVQIEGSENRIAFEKKNYNEAVKAYNILVKKHKDQYPDYEVRPYFSE